MRGALRTVEAEPLDGVPSLAKMMVTHGRLADRVPEMQAVIENDAATRLY
jgi:hypothetical protein